MVFFFVYFSYKNLNFFVTLYVLSIALGQLLMYAVQSKNFFFFFVCFVGINLVLYGIILLQKEYYFNQEYLLKFFYLSTLSTIFMAYTTWILSILFGTFDYDNISYYAYHLFDKEIYKFASFVVILFLFFSIFFKLAVFPCHFWTPELYKSFTFSLIFLLTIPVKITFLFVLYKWITRVFFVCTSYCEFILWTVALISISIGVLGAMYDRAWKSFFAFTSINQMGFLVAIIGCPSYDNNVILTYQITTYSIICGVLLYTLIILNQICRNLLFVDQLRWNKSNIAVAFALPACFFAFAGLPFFMGFFSKYLTFYLFLKSGFIYLTIISLFISLISAFYYLYLIRMMFYKNAITFSFKKLKPEIITSIVSLLVILNILWICFHNALLEYIKYIL